MATSLLYVDIVKTTREYYPTFNLSGKEKITMCNNSPHE
jgi:hypothetical protein